MRRPLSILIIGWLFIVTGAVGFFYHLQDFDFNNPFYDDHLWILIVRLLGILGGILVLRAYNLGRLLLVAWLAYHVALGVLHDWMSTILHTIFLVGISYFLFRKDAREFFSRRSK